MKVHILSLLLLGSLAATVQGLTCYYCNYTNVVPWYMPFCGDPFDELASEAKTSTVSCNGICIKSKGRIFYDGGYVEGLSRGCHAGMDVSECFNACRSQGRQEGCEYCCDQDLCNSAFPVTFHPEVLVTTLVFAFATLAF
ncbi:uncharacterized protein LOC110982430 [Acanthaster planci]|uniref:Uncharacterized protein LOC110982430 n=1 Tax=Acanthaster planci TaxID=133434 RepID=A0A8B7YZ69_ACAPL|nr:uncharacterized protein LOC110982430 [Acanthaster planci]